jgi:uncharacterized protein
MKRKKIFKRLFLTLITVFLLLNVVAFFHAWEFTHFTSKNVIKTKDAKDLSYGDKIKTLFLGIDNPRPKDDSIPTETFETINLQSNKKIECWIIKADNSKGTVILFHGYGGAKSSLLGKSKEFLNLGYSTLLVDFMGSGGSEGNQTTIGFREAEDVKTCYMYLTKQGERKIYLFGASMGAVAILKAVKDYNIQPAAIIIECPFGSMYQMICSRLKVLHVPSFPMAGLLDFWGGVQNGFWAFSFKPAEYAKSIKCPVQLLYGEQDKKVSRGEIDEIFSNLCCIKQLKTYPLAGHNIYMTKYKQKYIRDIAEFLKGTEKIAATN